jgi:hypothetical protein
VAKLPIESRVEPGESVTFAVALDRLYLFDQENQSAFGVET